MTRSTSASHLARSMVNCHLIDIVTRSINRPVGFSICFNFATFIFAASNIELFKNDA